MFVFEDEKNYKPCKLKQYDAYVCMPPKGTIVINKLESLGGINVGKEYFTPEEQLKFNDSQKNMISSLINNSNALHFVSDKEPFVLAGTCGELSVISPSELAQNYNFLQGNQPVGINQQNLNQRMTGEYLKWTLVRLKPSMVNYMACRVPTSIHTNIQTKLGMQSINAQGVSHGKGDFVVCNKLPNGKPDFSTRFVVNGNVFASTFNNQGWQDSIKDAKTVNISNLPNLVPNDVVVEKPIDAKSFRDKCDTLMKELQKIYKFTVSSNNYELVKDYRGIAKEVTFKGDTYVAKFTVSGNFSHTYHGKSGDNEVKANETFVYFGCSTHQDSALFMSIHPKTDNIYLTGWTFPSKGSESRSGYDYPKSKAGGISGINCAEEVKYFLNNNKGADYFIDNRGTDKNKDEEDNGEPIDAKAFRNKCDTLMKELQKVFKFKVISSNYELVDNYTGLAHEFKFDGKTYVAKYMVGGEFTHTPSSGNEFKVDKTAVWFGCSAHHRDSALTISMHPDIDKLYLSGWVFPLKRSKYMTRDLYPHCTSGTILTMNCAEEVQMFVDGCKCCDYIDNRDSVNDILCQIYDSKTVYNYLSMIFSGVTLAFKNEGYVIINSVFDQYDEIKEKEVYGGKLTINGDNDDKIVISMKLDSSDAFTLSARALGKSCNKTVKFDRDGDIDNFCNGIYNLVVKTFNLNQFNRVEKAVTSASKVLNCSSKLLKTEGTIQTYAIGDTELSISVSFGSINIANNLELKYFDNLRTITRGIVTVLQSNGFESKEDSVNKLSRLSDSINSRGKYKCSKIMFNFDSDKSFVFEFNIDNEFSYKFRYYKNSSSIIMLRCKDKNDNNLHYEYDVKSVPYSEDTIYSMIDNISTVEHSTWGSKFAELRNAFDSLNDNRVTRYSRNNLGDCKFNFIVSLKIGFIYENWKFILVSYTDEYKFNVVSEKTGNVLNGVVFVLPSTISSSVVEEKLASFISEYELSVKTVRNKITQLSDFINSQGKHVCSPIKFEKNASNNLFVFRIDDKYTFRFVYGDDDTVFLSHCLDIKGNSLPYTYDKNFKQYSDFAISFFVDFVCTQEESSWKGVFLSLREMMDSSKNLNGLVYNKGENYFYFKSLKDISTNKFMLVSYFDDYFMFKYVDYKGEKVTEDILELNKSLRGVELDKEVNAFIDRVNKVEDDKKEDLERSKVRKSLYNVVNKLKNDFYEFMYSGGVRSKLCEYRDLSLNADLIFRLFLTIRDVCDCELYTDAGNMFDNPSYSFSFDSENMVTTYRTDEDGDGIALTSSIDNYFECFYNGVFADVTPDNAELLLKYIQDTASDYIPREVEYFISEDYDFTYDFWFSMDNTFELLEECVNEFETDGFISDSTFYELKRLSDCKGSKVNIDDALLDSYERLENFSTSTKKSPSKDEPLDSLFDISDLFDF